MNDMRELADTHTRLPSLKGRTAIVTGGTTGIGRAIARRLAAEGVEVFIFGRDPRHLDDALAALRAVGASSRGLAADIADLSGVESVFKTARREFERLDLLVINAGISGEGVADMPEAEWRYVIETNLIGAMSCARFGRDWMATNRRGHIVFIGSMSAENESKDSSVYVASKSGLRGFAESFLKEVREDGIKVTMIEPGRVGSDMVEDSPEEQRRKIAAGEMLRAEDIAVAVQYAVSQPDRCDVTFMQVRPHGEKEG